MRLFSTNIHTGGSDYRYIHGSLACFCLFLGLAVMPSQVMAVIGTNDSRISFMGTDGDDDIDAVDADVAYNSTDNEYLVVWEANETINGPVEIYAQRFNATTGGEIDVRIRISDMGATDTDGAFNAGEPAVAYNSISNQYLIVWIGDDDTGALVDGEYEIFGQLLDADGSETGTNDFRISDMGSTDGNAAFTAIENGSDPEDFGEPSLAVAYNSTDNEYLVVWEGDDDSGALVDDEFEIYGQRISVAGAEIGANDFRISDMGPDGDVSFMAFDPAVAYNNTDNQYLVVWHGEDDTAPLVDGEGEIFGQLLNADGTEIGGDLRISNMGADGNTAIDANSAAVAYNTMDNEYMVVWRSDNDAAPLVAGEDEVYGQRLTAAGSQVGPTDFRISDMGDDGNIGLDANDPDIIYVRDDTSLTNLYWVTWHGDDTAGKDRIFAQIVSNTGVELGTDTAISNLVPGDGAFDSRASAIAYNSMDVEGLIVWRGDDNSGNFGALVDNENEIFGQRQFVGLTQVDLSIDLTVTPNSISPNGSVTYNVSATNNDTTNTAGGVQLTVTLDNDATSITAPGCTVSGTTVTCDAGSLAAMSSSATFTITATISKVAAGSTATATASALSLDTVDLNAVNNSPSVSVTIEGELPSLGSLGRSDGGGSFNYFVLVLLMLSVFISRNAVRKNNN